MDQHPIPRQITTFEFKLIGFMTLKQFIYLIIFFPIGFIVYSLVPIKVINIVFGVMVASIGLVFAFVPIQDRPIEEWIRNLIRRLNSPTQYVYKKKSEPTSLMQDLYFVDDPHITLTHVESKEKLAQYIQSQQAKKIQNSKKKKQKDNIHRLLKLSKETEPNAFDQTSSQPSSVNEQLEKNTGSIQRPFITGTIKNRKQIPLSGILVSILDQNDNQLRLLKTNPHGIFATYSPLSSGSYIFEMSDPNGNYFFDRMNVRLDASQPQQLTFYSKEIL